MAFLKNDPKVRQYMTRTDDFISDVCTERLVECNSEEIGSEFRTYDGRCNNIAVNIPTIQTKLN
jgi:hypothetical protein